MIDLGAQFDQLLIDLRGNRRFQRLVVCGVLLPSVFCTNFLVSAFLFVIAIPDHWCQLPLNNASLSRDDIRRLLPVDKDGIPDKCHLYSVEYSTVSSASNLTGRERIECAAWNYDRSNYHDTIVTDWDLVCRRDFLPTLAYLVYTLGTVIGTPLGGYLADKIGRKRTYMSFLFLQLLFTSATAGCPSAFYGYWVFIALTFIQSLSVNVAYLVPLTLGMELVTPDFRASYTILLSVAYTIGGMALSGAVYLIMPALSWRIMTLITTLPFVTYIIYFWLMPESPRWLLSKRKFDELKNFLRTVAKMNHVTISDATEKKFVLLCENVTRAEKLEKSSREYTYLDLFRGPQIRKQTLIMIVLNVACSACYYGLAYYAPSLGANPYLAYFLSCVVELPAALFTKLFCDRLGRKVTIMFCFLFGGTACLATLGVPPGKSSYAAVLALFLIAKLFVTSAYMMQELLQNELLPTVVRGKGTGLTNLLAAAANGIGPVVVYVGYSNSAISLVIFGGIMVFASICAMFLPETLNCALPETLEECEALGKKASWRDSMQLCRIPWRSS